MLTVQYVLQDVTLQQAGLSPTYLFCPSVCDNGRLCLYTCTMSVNMYPFILADGFNGINEIQTFNLNVPYVDLVYVNWK